MTLRGHGYRETPAWGFRGPECLACGGVRGAVKESGYTDDGLRIRRRACLDCGQTCASVEVFINPDLTTYARLDGRRMRRQRERQSTTYHKGQWRVPQRWLEPDQLRIRVETRERKVNTLPDDLLTRVCRHPEHGNPTISPEGWIVTGDEAWLPSEWAAHSSPALSKEDRKVLDRERKRLKYATDPAYREAQRERVRRNDAARRRYAEKKDAA